MKNLLDQKWQVRKISGVGIGIETELPITCDGESVGSYTKGIVELYAEDITEENIDSNNRILELIAATPDFLRIAHSLAQISHNEFPLTQSEKELVAIYEKIMHS